MNIFGALQALSTLVPLVINAVGAAEAFIGPRKGTEKLKHATRIVEDALPQVGALAQNIDAARAAIVPLIEATVAAANSEPAPKPKRRRATKRRRKARG